MKITMFIWIFATLFSFNLYADQIGNSGCGKPIVLRGQTTLKEVSSEAKKAMEGVPHPLFFKEEIYGGNFSILVGGLPEGKYSIEIYLAETTFKSVGQRVFSIYNSNKILIKDLDIFAKVGGNKEYVFTASVNHLDDDISGPLDIRFMSVRNFAKFNAIYVKNELGEIIACSTAKDLINVTKQYPIPDSKQTVIYTDDSYSIEKRLKDLIGRMSLNEKVGQLVNATTAIPRLDVPSYDYRNECLHGVARAGVATVFPQSIGMAAMWDAPLLNSIAETIATEARAKNNEARKKNPNTPQHYGLTFWSPNINIFRDPRWGRGQETYGEDPFLTGELGVAFIKGLQGTNPKYFKVLACAKHFAVHSGPEYLRHSFDAIPSKRDLYETYLPQFERAVKDAKVGSVMSSYNSLYGIPSPASNFLLTDILRDEWGFDGHVVSDCGGIRDVFKSHKYAITAAEASAITVKAGNDLNCGDTYLSLIEAYEQGLVTENDIDLAVSRVLKGRFQLGLFDSTEKCEYMKIPASENNSPQNSDLALKAAQKSIVLLKNNNILPLNKKNFKRIAVIGPNASSVNALLGNYNGTPSNPITILQGIKNEVGNKTVVNYAKGCPMALKEDETYSVDDNASTEAINLAKASDLTIFVGGIDGQIEREMSEKSWQGFYKSDRTKIELPESQIILLKKLVASGTPVIFVNMSGSAMAMPWIDENVNAIVQAWYPGQNGGTAVADVLFGNYNPAGRLPVTFYRSTEDLPPFTSYDMADRTYRYFTGKPLYAFGYGLSYTQFEYGNIKVSNKNLDKDGDVQVIVSVKNIGQMAGEEVVQLYVRHLNSPIPQALESLAGFKRVALEKDETKEVEFKLPASALRYWNDDKNAYEVPSGFFEVLIGSSSNDIRKRMQLQIL